nr:unnamed protein product [Callosobruchus chinensis]
MNTIINSRKDGTVEAIEKLKHHQDQPVAELKNNLKSELKSGQELVMNRLEEQRQAIIQTLEDQDQHINVIETSQKHAEEQLKHSGVVAKPCPYDGKTSYDVYYLQFENIARMNNWSDEKKACALTSMLRDSAAAILENLSSSDLRDYSKITSTLKLRFADAHLTELLHGQLHNRTQQAKEDLPTFAHEVQSLAKRAFVNSPIEMQEYVAARQFVEGIADLDVQRIVRLSSPRTLQDALVKALKIEAATKAVRMRRRVPYISCI